MASVQGLLRVRVKAARGVVSGSQVLVRFKLAPWHDESVTSCAAVDDDGNAEWEDEVVELAHLATTQAIVPQLDVDVRSRELFVLERALGHATLDAGPFVDRPGVASDLRIQFESPLKMMNGDAPAELELTVEFQLGVESMAKVGMRRSSSQHNYARQHLFKLTSYTWPTWCAVCDQLLVGVRQQGFTCESCGLDCHRECQLRAHAVHECQSDDSRAHVTGAATTADDDDLADLVPASASSSESPSHLEALKDLSSKLPTPTKLLKQQMKGSLDTSASGDPGARAQPPSRRPSLAESGKAPTGGLLPLLTTTTTTTTTAAAPPMQQKSASTQSTAKRRRRMREGSVGSLRLKLGSVRLLERRSNKATSATVVENITGGGREADTDDDATTAGNHHHLPGALRSSGSGGDGEAAQKSAAMVRGDHYVRIAVAQSRHAPRPEREGSSSHTNNNNNHHHANNNTTTEAADDAEADFFGSSSSFSANGAVQDTSASQGSPHQPHHKAAAKAWRRTHTVYQSSRPRFDCSWQLEVPTFAAEVRLELVDAASDVVVGSLRFGVLDVEQEAADAAVARLNVAVRNSASTNATTMRATPQSVFRVRAANGADGGRVPWHPRGPQYFDDPENAFFRDKNGCATALAQFEACDFETYADELWLCAAPATAAQAPPPDAFSIDITRRHIERATAIIHSISNGLEAYEDLMAWKRPAVTAPVFLGFVVACACFPAELVGALPFAALAALCASTALDRLHGAPRAQAFEHAARRAYEQELGGALHTSFRPVAHVKVAVCAGRSLGVNEATKPDLYTVVSYRNAPRHYAHPTTAHATNHHNAPPPPTTTTTTTKTTRAAAAADAADDDDDNNDDDDGDDDDDDLIASLGEGVPPPAEKKHQLSPRSSVAAASSLKKKGGAAAATAASSSSQPHHPNLSAPRTNGPPSRESSLKKGDLGADRTDKKPIGGGGGAHGKKTDAGASSGGGGRLEDEASAVPQPADHHHHHPVAAVRVPTLVKEPSAAATQGGGVGEHILGYTGTARKTTDPRWHGALGASLTQKRADISRFVASRFVASRFVDAAPSFAVLEPWERRGFGETESSAPMVDRSLVFPVLQPTAAEVDGDGVAVVEEKKGHIHNNHHHHRRSDATVPWKRSRGVLHFRVMRQHALDRLLDTQVGEVSVPLNSLVDDDESGCQRERRGWYDLDEIDTVASATSKVRADLDEALHGTKDNLGDGAEGASLQKTLKSTANTVMKHLVDDLQPSGGNTAPHKTKKAAPSASTLLSSSSSSSSSKKREKAALNLRLQLSLRDAHLAPTLDEAEISRTVDALHRGEAARAEVEDPSGAYSYSGAGSSVVKNTPLASVVSTGFSVHGHAVYAQNTLGRYLDFIESLKNVLSWTHPEKTALVFALTLAATVLFLSVPTRWLLLALGLYEFAYRLLPYDGSPMSTRVVNLLASVPTDDELRQCYHHRAKAYADRAVKDERRRTSLARLHGIWECRWDGPVSIRTGQQQTAWARKFVVLHGRRVLWWHSERDLEAGRAPGDQLLLHGPLA